MHSVTRTIISFDCKQSLKSRLTVPVMILWVAIIVFSVYHISIPQKALCEKIETMHSYYDSVYAASLKEMDSVESGRKKINVIWNNPQTAWVAASARGAQPVCKRPLPLSVAATGQSDLYSSIFRLNVNPPWYVVMTGAEKLDDPLNQLYGNFDLSFVITWLLPLLIILFNYNLLSSEKELGTLKLVSAQGVSVNRLLFTKVLFRFSWISLVTMLAAFIAIAFFGNNSFSNLSAVVSFLAFIYLYSACWHALLLFINTAGRSTAWNAGMSFASWLLFVIVLPALINITANVFFKTPSQVELITEIREASTNADQQSAENLDKYYYDHPEFAPKDSVQLMPGYMYPVALAYEASSRIVYPKISLYKSQLARQSKLVQNTGFFTPSILVQEAMEELSGNSMDAFIHYQNYADAANRKWLDYMFPRILGDKLIIKKEYESFEQYNYRPASSAGKLMKIATGLLLWLAVLMGLQMRLSKKLPVI